jgi:hypothetical protein
MSTHLSDAELRAFAEARLAGDDLMRADDHLSHCADCRDRCAALSGAPRAYSAVRAALTAPAAHLSDDEIHLLVGGQLEPSRRDVLERHLPACETCSQQVEDLRSWSARTRLRPLRPLAIAAAIVLAVLVPALVWQTRTARQQQATALDGFDQLTRADQAQVRASLDGGVARLPDFIAELRGSRETLMGGASSRVDTLAVTAPVGTATASDRPRFQWRPFGDAESYVVVVFDEQSNEVARSLPIEQSAWVPDRPLPRGQTYVWQVEARRKREVVVLPAAPMPPAKFHVVEQHTADVLERTASEHPQSHLLLGILNMNAGIVAEAARHFEQVGPTEQGADLARRSLDRLRVFPGS